MNKEQKLALLQQWKDAYDRNELATKPLRELIGDIPHDSVIYKALWDTFDQLTITTAMLIGDYEAGEHGLFMRWFEVDCGMGSHPQKIDGVLIDSLETFVGFL
jgi:hypothetical protein